MTLAPTASADEAALTEAAMVLPDELDGRAVVIGQEVLAGRTSFLVTGTDPPGRVSVSSKATELALAPRPLSGERRLVFDVLFLVDASWSMGRARADAPVPFSLVPDAIDEFVRQGGDLVRHAALATFTREPALLTAWAPLAALDVKALAGAKPRGRSDLARAIDFALGALAEGADARNRHAVVLFTDDPGDESAVEEAAKRASRVGVHLHVVDLGESHSARLRDVARATRGVYAYMPDGITLGPVFRALADDVEAPFAWRESSNGAAGGAVEFEVVLRAIEDEEEQR